MGLGGELKMDKNELISRILSYDNKIGRWKLYINEISTTDYAIGYGYDDSTKLWLVYQNGERGIRTEWRFEKEELAVEKLYKKVKFQYKIQN